MDLAFNNSTRKGSFKICFLLYQLSIKKSHLDELDLELNLFLQTHNFLKNYEEFRIQNSLKNSLKKCRDVNEPKTQIPEMLMQNSDRCVLKKPPYFFLNFSTDQEYLESAKQMMFKFNGWINIALTFHKAPKVLSPQKGTSCARG